MLCSESNIAKIRAPACCRKHRITGYLKVLQDFFLWTIRTINTMWWHWNYNTQSYYFRPLIHAILLWLEVALPSPPDMRAIFFPQKKVQSFFISRIHMYSSDFKLDHGHDPPQWAFHTDDHLVNICATRWTMSGSLRSVAFTFFREPVSACFTTEYDLICLETFTARKVVCR